MLIERRRDWDVLTHSLADARAGKGRVVLVSGGLGSGKTSLLHELCDYVVGEGAWLVNLSGSRNECNLRMGLISQLLYNEVLPQDAPGRQAALAAVEFAAEQHADADGMTISFAEATVAQRVRELVFGLEKTAPVVIVVDDIHLADRPSLQVFLYLIRRMRSARVLVAAAESDYPQSTRRWGRAELVRSAHHQIRLTRLSAAGVAELLDSALGGAAASEAGGDAGTSRGAAAHALTGGNPLLAHALAADQIGGPDEQSRELVVGRRFTRAVLECLHHLDSNFLAVARAVGVLGANASPDLVRELVESESDAVAQVLGVLSDTGVLLECRFRHPEVTAAVLEDVPPAARARLHRHAARLLYERGSSAAEVCAHLIAAGDASESWAVQSLRDAAEAALIADRADTAAQMLMLALRFCNDHRDSVAITVALATVEWRRNPSAAFLRLAPLQDVLRADDLFVSLPGREAITVIRYLLWRGELEPSAEALTKLQERNGVDARTVAQLNLAFQSVYGSWRGPGPDPVAQQKTQGSSNPWLRATASLTSAPRRRRTDDVVTSAEHILHSCGLNDSTLEPIVAALFALSQMDKADIAVRWCDALLDEAMRREVPTWQAMLSGVRAELALRQGDLPLAKELAGLALEILPAQSWGVFIGLPLSTLLSACTTMGEHDAAANLLRQIVPEAMFETVFGLLYLRARGHYHLLSGRFLVAYNDFQRCGKLMSHWDVDWPVLVPWRSDLAQVFLQLDRCAEARELASEQLTRATTAVPRTRGISLRILAASSELKQRPRLLREAIDHLQASCDRLELARALADLSQVHHDFGDFSRARMMAHRAAQEGKACQAGVSAIRLAEPGAQERKAEQPVTAPIGDAAVLSDAERRVAALAALGHTNREIGLKLYVTPSTVEQHLTRVYRKLKVSGRKDLHARLA